MLVSVSVHVECDSCGKRFKFDMEDHAHKLPADWTIFDLAMDVTRWRGTGHVFEDGRWLCDECDKKAST